MRIWWRFIALLKPYRGCLLVTFCATLTRPLLNAAKIYLLKLIVDNLAQSPSSRFALVICGAYLIIALVKGFANYFDQYFGSFVGGRVVIDLRDQVYDRFLRLSLRYHGEHRVGEGISRLISDVGAVEDLLVAGITDGLTQVLTVLVFAGMLFYLDPFLALISLLVLPFLFASLVVYARKSRVASREVRVRLANLTSATEEGLSTIGLVKTFMRMDYEESRLRERGKEHWQARLLVAKLRGIYIPLSDVVATVGTVLVIYFGTQALRCLKLKTTKRSLTARKQCGGPHSASMSLPNPQKQSTKKPSMRSFSSGTPSGKTQLSRKCSPTQISLL